MNCFFKKRGAVENQAISVLIMQIGFILLMQSVCLKLQDEEEETIILMK